MNKNVIILGGGPAGMALAFYADKADIRFELYEASKTLGGNAKTLKSNEFYFDTGAHRWHDKIPEITTDIKKLLGDELVHVNSPSKIYYNKKFINFPISFFNLIKALPLLVICKIVFENLKNIIGKKSNPTNFQDLVYSQYGKTLSNLFLTNYTEKLWGTSSKNLLTTISGKRLNGLSIKNIILEFINKNSLDKHLDGSFYYPKWGFGSIFTSIEEKVNSNSSIKIDSKITKIFYEKNLITGIEINNKKNKSVNGTIFSTLPISIIIKSLEPKPPDSILKIIDSIKFRGVFLGVIFLKKIQFSKNASIYFPDKNISFNRIYEPKNRSKYLATKDTTCIVVERCLNQSKMNDINEKSFLTRIKKELIDLNFINENEILGDKIFKINYAYPILDINIEKKIKKLKNYLNQFDNLKYLGRNALFEYTHVHNLFSDSKKCINEYVNETIDK